MNRRVVFGVVVSLSSLGLLLNNSQAQSAKLRVGLGYIPDVQFAPFYLAQHSGLYKAAGLEVEFQHGFTSELYPLLAAGKLDFVVGDAEDVVLLRSKDAKAAPFKFVMAMYQSVPNALFSKAEKNIKTIKDLKGKNIGVPGKFGTSWTSLQAVLKAANLKETDVKITEVGFTQLEAVLSDRVDVAMGFVNNEPVVASARGVKLSVIAAGRYNRSPGNGVLTTDERLKDAKTVRAFLEASQKGLAQTIKEPKVAFEAAKKFVQGLTDDRIKVLEASLPLYQSPFSQVQGLGFSNPNGWEDLLNLLKSVGRLEGAPKRGEFYTNAFLAPKLQAK
jgi:NitT/TauT family transport system substrate-binding protein